MSGGRLEPEYDPRLVEAALLVAVTGHRAEREFRAERDRLYEMAEPEARERAFVALHARWFGRFGLDRPVHEALAARPELAAACERCLVARARGGRDEAADLLVAPPARPVLVVRVTAETLAAPDRLRGVLRHELTHVSDMLDPRFGYTPDVPAGVAAGGRERLVRENYRVLWDAYVDGRLARAGLAPAGVRDRRLAEFTRAFGHLGAATAASFERFFGAPALTHGEMLAFAAGDVDGRARRCPLCDLPARALAPALDALPPAARAAIVGDFPAWRPADGLCGRCAELYASRAAACS